MITPQRIILYTRYSTHFNDAFHTYNIIHTKSLGYLPVKCIYFKHHEKKPGLKQTTTVVYDLGFRCRYMHNIINRYWPKHLRFRMTFLTLCVDIFMEDS